MIKISVQTMGIASRSCFVHNAQNCTMTKPNWGVLFRKQVSHLVRFTNVHS